VRFILHYPEANGSEIDLLDAGAIADIASAAEAAGFDGISVTEHPAPSATWLASGGHQSLDPFVALASAAGVTSRLALVTNLSVVPYRNPLLLAKSAATLNRVSEGRACGMDQSVRSNVLRAVERLRPASSRHGSAGACPTDTSRTARSGFGAASASSPCATTRC